MSSFDNLAHKGDHAPTVFLVRVRPPNPRHECGCEVCRLQRVYPTITIEYCGKDGDRHRRIQPVAPVADVPYLLDLFRSLGACSATAMPTPVEYALIAAIVEVLRVDAEAYFGLRYDSSSVSIAAEPLTEGDNRC